MTRLGTTLTTMMNFHLSENGLSWIWTLAVLGGTLAYIGLIAYRLWLHPLARFPGPRLAGATHWYEAYYELVHRGGGQYAPKIREMHRKYGPIIRINPDEISVNDAEFHDTLYAPQPEVRDRHPAFSAALGTAKGSFSTPGHDLHRHRRMAYNPFFASANVTASEFLVKKKVNHLCDLLWFRRENIQNIRIYLTALSFDSFYTWAFGSSLDLLDDLPLAERCIQAVEVLVTSPPFYRIFPLVMSCIRKAPHGVLRYLSRHIAMAFDLHAVIRQAAERFVENDRYQPDDGPEKPTASYKGSQPETLFSVLRRSKAPDEEKTASRMSQEGVEMFMATYTPGRSMMLGLYCLHSNPHVLEALRNELDQANPDPRADLTVKSLNSLPYLRAVTKEMLRVTFPVGTRLPMICHEDVDYRGWKIPAQTAISVNHRSVLFDPAAFPEPFEFRPERWLDNENPIDEKRHFVAFGKGGRGCPGREFATQLIQITIATLVQRFEFRVTNTTGRRDVAVSHEALLTAPVFENVQFSLVGKRRHGSE